MSVLARRGIPADPAVREALRIARRAAKIAGPQHQILTCWLCGADLEAQATETWRARGADLTVVCADEDECSTRAARTGRVPVIGDPDQGGDAA